MRSRSAPCRACCVGLATIFCLGCADPGTPSGSAEAAVELVDNLVSNEMSAKQEAANTSPTPTVALEAVHLGKVQSLPDEDAVKQSVPFTEQWLVFDYSEASFLCSQGHFPTWGNPPTVAVECWMRSAADQPWQQVLQAKAIHLDRGELSFDAETGLLTLQRDANGSPDAEPILSIDLKAISSTPAERDNR